MEPTLVVLPTGSGKTAVSLLAAFVERAKRVLVVTPSRLVRNQITEEYKHSFSGVFYGEVCSSLKLMPVEEFLNRAWSQKGEYIFCGIPGHLSIPKTVAETFPDIHDFIRRFGIETLEVTSGFQGGVRDVPTWENYLRHLIASHSNKGDPLSYNPCAESRKKPCAGDLTRALDLRRGSSTRF
jgi:hypothetical protein